MDHLTRSARNGFASGGVDRLHHLRGDAEWVAARLGDDGTAFVPVWRSKNLIAAGEGLRAAYLRRPEVAGLLERAESVTLLGEAGGTAFFGLGLAGGDEEAAAVCGRFGAFQDLRTAAALLERQEGALLAQARAYVHWHRGHLFCGRCGAPTQADLAGHVRVCTGDRCGRQIFPRLDPAIIVLVTCGEQCLLGRQPQWPEKRYSTLAGFVEPGESIEEAVVREVAEEAGAEVIEVTYHSSQPWPFPSSLMLGFTAKAAAPRISLDHLELEDARWFSRAELASSLRQGDVVLPYSVAISYHLIEDWFDAKGPDRLVDLTTHL